MASKAAYHADYMKNYRSRWTPLDAERQALYNRRAYCKRAPTKKNLDKLAVAEASYAAHAVMAANPPTTVYPFETPSLITVKVN